MNTKGEVGMKRCFSLLIALVLLVALFPAGSALAECSHSKTTHMCDFYILNKGNSQYHYYVEDSFNKCNDCGAELWPYYNEEPVPHDFVGNKCSECGYQKSSSSSSCPHSKTKEVAGDKKYEIIDGNDRQHNVITNYSKVCTQCNKTIFTDKKTQVAAHSFSGSTCTVCGYSKAGTATQRPAATTTPRPSNTNNGGSNSSAITFDSYVQADDGVYTISWRGSLVTPYKIVYTPSSGGEVLSNSSVYGNSYTTKWMIPGMEYTVTLTDANGTTATGKVNVPRAESFRDGNLTANKIDIQISPRYTKPGYAPVHVQSFNASTMEANMTNKGWTYGLFYRINLSSFTGDRTYLQTVVFRAPNGYNYMWTASSQTYYYGGSDMYWRWKIMGEEFFEELLDEYGRIPTGKYYVDLYWDGMLVDSSSFQVY